MVTGWRRFVTRGRGLTASAVSYGATFTCKARTTMTQTLINSQQADGIAWITLDRAEKKNALSNSLLDQLNVALDAAIASQSIRAIVLSGAGNCFCAGRDTSEFGRDASLQDGSLDVNQAGFLKALSTLSDCAKPTIAMVHGFAFGGGQAMTLACDFVVAERYARFGNVEMAHGFPAAMNIALLAKHLGRRIGLEIAVSGDVYSAERYYELGLVNRLAEAGTLRETTDTFATMLASRAQWAVARTKTSFRVAEDLTLSSGLHMGGQLNQLLMLMSQTQPVHAGVHKAKKD